MISQYIHYVLMFFSVDCLYTPTDFLRFKFDACVIQPGECVDVPFEFVPREARKYKEVVTFEINGLTKQDIEFSGTGTEMKVIGLKLRISVHDLHVESKYKKKCIVLFIQSVLIFIISQCSYCIYSPAIFPVYRLRLQTRSTRSSTWALRSWVRW